MPTTAKVELEMLKGINRLQNIVDKAMRYIGLSLIGLITNQQEQFDQSEKAVNRADTGTKLRLNKGGAK